MPVNPQPCAAVITVTTAVEMDDGLRAQVRAKVDELFGEDARISEQIDPRIVGGIVIEGAGHRYDASVRAQLAHVRNSLSSTFMGGVE